MTDDSGNSFSVLFSEALGTKVSRNWANVNFVEKVENSSIEDAKSNLYNLQQIYGLYNNYNDTKLDYRLCTNYIPSESEDEIYELGNGYGGN